MRWAQIAALALVAVVAVAVAAAVPGGVNGAIINHALLPLGGAMDANRASCLSGAHLDYDAYDLSAGALSSWANVGQGGSEWDLTQPVGANQPMVTTSCNGAGGSCVLMADTSDYVYQTTAASTTWAGMWACALIYYDGVGTDYQVGWNNATSNYYGADAAIDFFFRGNSSTSTNNGTASAGWHTTCHDYSDATSVRLWVDGTLTNAGFNLTTASDPSRITLGALTVAGGFDAVGSKFGRVMFWTSTPPCSAPQIDQALRAERGLL